VARPLTAPAVPSMPAAPAAQTAPASRPEPGEPGPPAAPRATKAHRGDRFAGARVLVTGASSGIGAATARSLASRGALLAAAGRNEDRVIKNKKVIKKKLKLFKNKFINR
jgi:NADPH:quinone reductase-like Zn-dependent oxidoreductase